MSRVILQRHTHPDIDLKICYGWSDIQVREEYLLVDLPCVVEQYKELQHVKDIAKIYSSPLQRCSRLAADLQHLTSAREITFDDRLKELNFGDWELQRWDDIYNMEGSRAWFDDYLNVPATGGESFVDLYRRVESFFETLRSRDEDALVVTHSGVIRAAMAIIGRCELSEVFDSEVKYGGVIEIEL